MAPLFRAACALALVAATTASNYVPNRTIADTGELEGADMCHMLEEEGLNRGYAEDCRVEKMPTGIMLTIYRGSDVAFKPAYQCASDILLPGENMWTQTTRAALYLFALLYCFLGIAIVADIFMGAIEEITSKKVESVIINAEGKEETVEELYWNGTVANLTLMALGSSAPEILLSVLGVVTDLGGEADPLGANTIVGSAAFNLLCISAVCILAPCPETRRIKQFGVFKITAFFSVWAYIWLLIIIDFVTPEVIDSWEAAVTFLHFPLLVILAYGADREWDFSSSNKKNPNDSKGTLSYRMNAVRMLSGGARINFVRRKKEVSLDVVDEEAPEMNKAGLSSDPYVVLHYEGQKEKTVYKKKSLNPKYNQAFSFEAYNPESELKIEVFDHDELSADDFMGTAKTSIAGATEEKSDIWVKLTDSEGRDGHFGEVKLQFYIGPAGNLIIKVVEAKDLIALEKSNAAIDAVASAIGNQKRRMTAYYRKKAAQWEDISGVYKLQFQAAMQVNGPMDDDGNEQPPTGMDLLMHFLTVFWKVFFALIPSSQYYGGWVAFSVALSFIGGVTYIVGEIATLFGCSVGLETAVTAITFVALGTSLPDTFASKLAAVNEATADNAVGNVTGSNGVNVFLGIGLPWLIGALYCELVDDSNFYARSNGFGLSVAVFCALAILFLGLLVYRRYAYGGELGGPPGPAKMHACIAVSMWFTYVVVASLRLYGDIDDIWTIDSEAPIFPPPPPMIGTFLD